jgi:Protein of unknown function (DUF2970)
MSAPAKLPQRPPQSLVRSLLAVAWSFLGVRKDSEFKEDLASIKPLHVMLVGVVAGFGLVIVLMLIARWMVKHAI